MGYFDFLSPDLEGDEAALPQAKSYVPEGYKVRRKGEDFWRTDETEAGPEDELAPKDTTPTATTEEMKPYSQRRGELTSQVFQTADQILKKYENVTGTTAADDARRQIRAKPEDAPKIIEKFFEKNAAGQRVPDEYGKSHALEQVPQLYDQNFTALENSVRNLRVMKRGPEETALKSAISQQDLSKDLNELQNLRGQLDVLTKDIASNNLPEAVSGRGERENRKLLGDKQAQAAAISEHIKQLEEKTGNQQPAPVAKPPLEEQAQENEGQELHSLQNSQAPVSEYLGALGVPKEKVVDTLHKGMQLMGVGPEQWDDRIPTHPGMLRALAAMDPKGTFAQGVANDLSNAKAQDQQDQQQKMLADEENRQKGAIDQLQTRVGQREVRMRELYAKLNEAPFMQTWPGIFLYIITGMLVGPGIATKLFGNLDNRRAIGNELNSLKFELRRLDGQIEAREKEMNYARRAAILRMTHKDDRAEDFTRDVQKMFLQQKLILERQKQLHPEQKGAYDNLAKAFTREHLLMKDAQHRKDEAQRILSNDFSDEKDKVNARRDMNIAEQEIQNHKGRIDALHGTIMKLGGVNLDEGEEEAQQ